MGGDNVISSDRRRRRRAVDGEQLLALGARCAKAGRAKEDGVGRTAVVLVGVVASPPAVAELMQEYAVPETSTAFGIDQSYNEASLVRPAASETRLIDLYLRRL